MTFAMLWANKYVRYGVALVAIAVALFAAAKHFEAAGAERGRQDQGQEIAKAIEASRKADRADLDQQMKSLAETVKAAQSQAAAAQQLGMALALQRAAATKEVAGMSDAQVEAAVRRAVGDPAAPAAQREFLECRTQLPMCEKERTAAKDEALHEHDAGAKLQDSVAALDRYTTQLEKNYVDLWNVKAVKVRSWKCLKLWRCSRPQIAVPAPAEALHRPAVQTSAVGVKP